MNENIEKFKQWWLGLAERERKVLTVGVIFVVLALFYLIIWSPYLERVDALRHQIQSEQKTLAAMETMVKEIDKLQAQVVPKANLSSTVELLAYLQKQLEKSGLDSGQLKQSSNDAVQLHFQKVEFDRLIGMLVKVAKEQAMQVTQMSVVADAAPGIVNADVTIKVS